MTTTRSTPPSQTLNWSQIKKEVTRRIVAAVQPQRVLAFGSSARGHLTPDSDLDILVIVRGPAHRRQLAQKIYRNLHGIGVPVDVVVVTEEDIANYGDKPGTILRPALLEGQVLYDAR
ncbi:MAG: nucleotidyltransferase domain-containing protein [Chloroflexota bacterium]